MLKKKNIYEEDIKKTEKKVNENIVVKKEKNIMDIGSSRKKSIMENNCEHEHSIHDGYTSDQNEETMKNVVSSRGKFVSLLQARSICNFFSLFYIIFIINSRIISRSKL